MPEKRILWIDIAKFIGIYLVVLGHIHLQNQYIWNYIYSFHMPLFFMISGILDKGESLKNTLIKASKRLLIPYITFYIISFCWWIYFGYIRDPNGIFSNSSFTESALKMFYGFIFCNLVNNTSYSYSPNAALWFIIALFEMKIILVFTNLLQKNLYKLTIVILFIIIHYILLNRNINIAYSVNPMLQNLPFFFMGFYLKKEIISFANKYFTKKNSLFLFVTSLIISFSLGYLDFNIKQYLYIPIALLGILMIISLSNFTIYYQKRTSFIKFVSNNTLTIMCVHGIFNGLLLGAFKIMFKLDTSHVPLYIALFVALVSFIGSLFVAKIMNKYMPTLIGISKTR